MRTISSRRLCVNLSEIMSAVVVAAVVSACVAGGLTLVKSLLDLAGGGRIAARQAHRELLGQQLASLGRDLPGIVACATVYYERSQAGESTMSWRKRAEAHGEGLKESRPDLRYLLYGADEGFRVLSRVASWIQHYGVPEADGTALLDGANTLRDSLDVTVAKSYRRGEPPTWLDGRRISRSAASLRVEWETHMGQRAQLGRPKSAGSRA